MALGSGVALGSGMALGSGVALGSGIGSVLHVSVVQHLAFAPIMSVLKPRSILLTTLMTSWFNCSWGTFSYLLVHSSTQDIATKFLLGRRGMDANATAQKASTFGPW